MRELKGNKKRSYLGMRKKYSQGELTWNRTRYSYSKRLKSTKLSYNHSELNARSQIKRFLFLIMKEPYT